MDRFDTISAFVAVIENDGFAPAARKLGYSPSAVTRLVADLEERLGVRLLNRTTRSVSLTDAGARFLERGRRILADLSEAELAAENERGEPSGRLSVTAPLIFGRLHVAPLLCNFMMQYPKVQAELNLSDRNIHLVEDGVDLAIRIGELIDSADIARKAGHTRRVLVASPGYIAQHGRPQTPHDLQRHCLIAFSALTSPRRWRFHNKDRAITIDVTPGYVTNSADAAIWHAAHNGGLTMALSYQVMDHLRSGTLQIVLPDFEPPPLPIQFVYASSRLLSVKVRMLIDMGLATCNWSFDE
ncbi:MAG: LysR family transcriptional regulator [Beijerinckiaceae bacterium]